MAAHIPRLLSLALFAAVISCQTTSSAIYQDSNQKFAVYASSETRLVLIEANKYGNLKEAIAVYKIRLKKNPRDTKTLTSLSRLYLLTGDLEKAETYAQVVKRYNYRDRPAKVILANIEYLKGHFEAAKLILTQMGGARSPELEVLILLAGIALQQGEDNVSINLLQQTIKRSPKHLAAHMNLGLIYLKHQEFKASQTHFKRVLNVLPGNKDAMLHLAIVYAALGQFGKANNIYQELYTRFPDDSLVIFNLAVLKFRQKDYPASISFLQDYVEKAPSRYIAKRAAMDIINEIQLDAVQKGGAFSNDLIEELTQRLADADQGAEPLSFDKKSELNSGFVFTSVGYVPD